MRKWGHLNISLHEFLVTCAYESEQLTYKCHKKPTVSRYSARADVSDLLWGTSFTGQLDVLTASWRSVAHRAKVSHIDTPTYTRRTQTSANHTQQSSDIMADMTAKQEQLCSSYRPHHRRVTQQCVWAEECVCVRTVCESRSVLRLNGI